ncbi:NADH oxidase [Deferribacter autotrophicus]|uniref:NADH oxidase n=1 Tax=Deferribacter autotrophicus TaxID=500465 RepID=A0A5A8F0I8_9BACT|nr:FAD-dependent oxidoreductase [Deferribacter autotrophicus]KAA0256827.1 NADH oxidase [Deferribacter autotrophicus]
MKIVIIGGIAGGLTCASNIKRKKKDFEVVVFEKGGDVSYGACGMPYNLMFPDIPPEELYALSLDEIINKRGVDYRLNHEVIEVDLSSKIVTVKNDKGTFQEKYDKLVIATGARSNKIPIFNNEPDSFYFKTLEDLKKVKGYLQNKEVKTVCLIGAGYVNLELAEVFSEMGKKIIILEKMDKILPAFCDEVRKKVYHKMKEKNIDLHLNVDIISKTKGKLETNKGTFEADMFIISAGVTPNSEMFDVEKGVKNAIKVNRYQQTNVEDVYAVGDVTLAYNRIIDDYVYYPLGTTANKQGRVAAHNIVYGNTLEFFGIVQTAVFKFFEYTVATTGLNEFQMNQLDIDFEKTVIISHTRGAYPGRGRLSVILYHDKESRKILGCQMVGEDVVAKRIDIVATAISMGATVDEFAWFDLSYSPPFSPVWDPVLIAAQKAMKK